MRRYIANAITRPITIASPISIVLPITIVLLLAACTKTSSPSIPPSTISASINGTPTTFNIFITVDTLSSPGAVYIVAHADSANLTPLFEITLIGTPLKPGTYPFTDTAGGALGFPTGPLVNPGSGPLGLLGYTLWSGDSDLQYSAVTDTVTLTTVTKTWFSGTFQGTCAYNADSAVSITNGQFTVSYPEH